MWSLIRFLVDAHAYGAAHIAETKGADKEGTQSVQSSRLSRHALPGRKSPLVPTATVLDVTCGRDLIKILSGKKVLFQRDSAGEIRSFL